MSLFSFIGSFLGGKAAASASKKATKAQVEAANKAIAEQQRQFDLTRSDYAPYLAAGTTGLGQLGDLIGTGGAEKQQSAIDALKASPFYQSLYRTGEEAVLQNASATGGLRGGNTQRSLADFGSDTLMQTIQQQLSSLGGLAGMGVGATGAVANFGANKANAIGAQYGNIGNAQASGYLARGGIAQQQWNNAGSFIDDSVAQLAKIFAGGF